MKGIHWLAVVAWGAIVAAPAAALDRPLTAEDAVRMALERNLDVLSSEQSTRIASGNYLNSLSQVLPSLSASGSYNNTIRTSLVFTSAGVREESEFYSGRVSLNQSLVSFPNWASLRSAASGKEAAREGHAANRADIALAAYQQFYALLKAQKLAGVARDNLVLSRDQLRRIDALFELGSVARGDVLKQKVQLSQAELDDLGSRRQVEVEEARLARMLGLDPTQPVPIDTTLTIPELAADSASVFQAALASRPELAAARADLRSAEANLGSAQGQRYPSVDGTLSYSFTTAGWPDELRTIDEEARWSALLSLNLPIFDGLRTKGDIRRARAQRLQAEYAVRRAELDVAVEVEEVWRLAGEARERILVTRAGLDAAEEDLKLSREKYNVGSATVLELIDAQVSLARARSNYVSALADAHVAELQLRRVRGERF